MSDIYKEKEQGAVQPVCSGKKKYDKGIHEECGVFGIWSPERAELSYDTYYGLFALQHRGQEAAGIAVNDDGVFRYHKAMGLVSDVFSKEKLAQLGAGRIAVGHVRYSTSGESRPENAQPMVVRHRKGNMALCHNGNLVNSFELREELEMKGCIFHTTSDTEVISYIVTQERIVSGSIEEAVSRTMDRIEGAYSLVVMSPSKLIACRDEHGFRPLCMGKTQDGSVVFASESCALDAVDAVLERELDPGEIVIVDDNGIRSIRMHCGKKERRLCVFEYIYFARPDSVIDGVGVHAARIRTGELLAKEHPVDADVVIGVPDSGLDAASGFAKASGIPYGIGMIKNKYIGRTFISPGQEERRNLVKIKLNAVEEVVRGRRVVLVDDSIVRGTTSARIVKLIRDAGAKEVHLRISAPPFTNPCYYGVDIDSRENLIACSHTVEEIAEIIGVDSLGYLSIESARKLASKDINANIENCGVCCACFDGKYPTRTPSESSKNRFEQKISKEWRESHKNLRRSAADKS